MRSPNGTHVIRQEMKAFAAASALAIPSAIYHGYCHGKGIPHTGIEHLALLLGPVGIHAAAEGLTGAVIGYQHGKEDYQSDQHIERTLALADGKPEETISPSYQQTMAISRAFVYGVFTGGIGTVAGGLEVAIGTTIGYTAGVIAAHLT